MDTTIVGAIIGAVATVFAAWWTVQTLRPHRRETSSSLNHSEAARVSIPKGLPAIVTFRDGSRAHVVTEFVAQITKAQLFARQFGGEGKDCTVDDARRFVEPHLTSVMLSVLGRLTFTKLQSDRSQAERDLLNAARARLSDFGVSVLSANLVSVEQTR